MKTTLAGRLAGPNDDAGLRRLLRNVTMPGGVRLACEHEPSFFEAIEVQGRNPRVLVGEREGEILGCGVMAERSVFINGLPAQVGYLSTLRLDPRIQRSTALARGYRMLRQFHEERPAGPFYLTTVMHGNESAEALLTSGRCGLPHYHLLGQYHTAVLPVCRGSCRRAHDAVDDPPRETADELCQMLNDWGSEKQFYPDYTARDLASPVGLLRGLGVQDFLVARDARGAPEGLMACWDQTPFRRHVVTAYRGLYRLAYELTRAVSPLLGWPALTRPGEPVRAVVGACVAVRRNDPAVFRRLLRSALSKAAALGQDYLTIGLMAGDPLETALQGLPRLTLHSRIYGVSFEAGDGLRVALDRRPMYLELGSL